MSSFLKYNTITSYLETSITGLAAFANFTVFIGDPVEAPQRPYSRISLDSLNIEDDGFGQYQTIARINVGIEALYQAEQTFLANLDELIDEINSNAATVCGVEFLRVASAQFSSEDAAYSRCVLTIEATYY